MSLFQYGQSIKTARARANGIHVPRAALVHPLPTAKTVALAKKLAENQRNITHYEQPGRMHKKIII